MPLTFQPAFSYNSIIQEGRRWAPLCSFCLCRDIYDTKMFYFKPCFSPFLLFFSHEKFPFVLTFRFICVCMLKMCDTWNETDMSKYLDMFRLFMLISSCNAIYLCHNLCCGVYAYVWQCFCSPYSSVCVWLSVGRSTSPGVWSVG